jgi:hypothetical protein
MPQPWSRRGLERKLERNSLPEITLIGILFRFDCQSCQRDRQLSCSRLI